ncbi:MAG: PAS domain-containing protein [Labilithrix sp.]|nr:PAS domain-containing protein [Labilithrix sp.]
MLAGTGKACVTSDRDRYRETLDHLLEGFQIVAPDWTYVYVNPSAANHGRKTPDELVGKKMTDVYPGIESTPLFAMLARAMDERTRASMENLFGFADGTTRWFELRVDPVPEGLCIHSIDIDDRKQAEAALRRANEDLEQRVAERTSELAAANRDLEAFAYAVAHDLRAPLRAVDGFGLALEEEHGEQLDAEGRKYLTRMRVAARRMGALIDDLLSLSRVGRATLARVDVDVSALARQIASDLEHGEPGRRVAWKIAPDLLARADAGLARIVFENLLGNAWKFTARREEATIEVRASHDAPGAVVVIDNGAGFDMSHAQELFKPFRRLHSEHEFTGTGIGLATVFRIVDRHGGAVSATGVVDQGAAITVRFEP